MDPLETPEAAVPGPASAESEWEAAYARFETPADEVRKFTRRLQWLGADRWPRDHCIVDLFCGRGNGLVALEQLGFQCLEGVDWSAHLLGQYQGRAVMHQADCRHLPIDSASRHVVMVHGGLHHLEQIPADLALVLAEADRVLLPGGLLAVVEPWSTPFLRLVHAACGVNILRRMWPKLGALATMIENEKVTYHGWLGQPDEIIQTLTARFEPLRSRQAWGKLWFLGRKRA